MPGMDRALTFESVRADLDRLRQRGLIDVRRLHLPALHSAARRCGYGGDYEPAAIEGLLRAAVERLGDGQLGTAAGYTFGLVSGTRDWPAYRRRRRGSEVYGVGVDRFRKHYEKVVLDQTAEAVRSLCREETPRRPAATEQTDTPLRSVEEAGEFALSRMLPEARRVDLYGRTMINMLNQYAHQLARLVRAGGTVRMLLLDPAVPLGGHLYPLVPGQGEARLRRSAQSAAVWLRLLRAADEESAGAVEIRVTGFLPPYSMVGCVAEEVTDSKIVVQLNLMYTRTGRDRPLLCIAYDNPWYEVFTGEFEEAWQQASPWVGAPGRDSA